MLSIASGITGTRHARNPRADVGATPSVFASPENEWRELFLPYLPEWLTVSDSKVARGYYEGEVNLYTPEQLIGWVSPVLWWTTFIFMLVFGMFCINVIIRKQWIEHEKTQLSDYSTPTPDDGDTTTGFFSVIG